MDTFLIPGTVALNVASWLWEIEPTYHGLHDVLKYPLSLLIWLWGFRLTVELAKRSFRRW